MINPSNFHDTAPGMLENAVQGTHATIDRLAVEAAPAASKLHAGVAAAEDAVHATTDQLRRTRDEWALSMRASVRRQPLVAVAAAFALGAVIARITR